MPEMVKNKENHLKYLARQRGDRVGGRTPIDRPPCPRLGRRSVILGLGFILTISRGDVSILFSSFFSVLGDRRLGLERRKEEESRKRERRIGHTIGLQAPIRYATRYTEHSTQQSQHRHTTVTAHVQHSHSTVTAQSQHSRSTAKVMVWSLRRTYHAWYSPMHAWYDV